jgi:hypothetical protein
MIFFRKPVPTFQDHALVQQSVQNGHFFSSLISTPSLIVAGLPGIRERLFNQHAQQPWQVAAPRRAILHTLLHRQEKASSPKEKGRPGSHEPGGLADGVPTDQGSVPSLR